MLTTYLVSYEYSINNRISNCYDMVYVLRTGNGRKGERDDEEDDDGFTFLGPPPSLPTADQKLNNQGLYLNTRLARKNSEREADDDENADGCQRQIAPVTVSFFICLFESLSTCSSARKIMYAQQSVRWKRSAHRQAGTSRSLQPLTCSTYSGKEHIAPADCILVS